MSCSPLVIPIGARYGRLTVIGPDGKDAGGQRWKCQCDCGAISFPRASTLNAGRVQSCGCLTIERVRTHNMTLTPEYRAWQSMKRRCGDPRIHNYRRYGGRGIKVCNRWLDSFENFLADVGLRPSPNHSIDRVDNNGNYEPGNVKWRTATQQGRNTRSNVRLTFNGRTLCISEWAETIGLDGDTLWMRLKRGWTVERALTQVKGFRQRSVLSIPGVGES